MICDLTDKPTFPDYPSRRNLYLHGYQCSEQDLVLTEFLLADVQPGQSLSLSLLTYRP